MLCGGGDEAEKSEEEADDVEAEEDDVEGLGLRERPRVSSNMAVGSELWVSCLLAVEVVDICCSLL